MSEPEHVSGEVGDVPPPAEPPATALPPFMQEQKKMKALVVDANGLIKGVRLETMAEKLYTTRDVVAEVRDKAARERLATGVIELEYREPTPESLKAVMAFARKTGDYSSLSAVDLRVLALTWTLEKEIKGSVDHLRTEPVRSQPRIKGGGALLRENAVQIGVVGIDVPAPRLHGHSEHSTHKATEGETKGEATKATGEEEEAARVGVEELSLEEEHPASQQVPPGELEEGEEEEEEEEEGEGEEEEQVEGSAEEEDRAAEGQGEEGFVTQSTANENAGKKPARAPPRELADDEGWITPSNIHKVNKNFDPFGNVVAEQRPDVACLTTDFAMQNVLIQMGLAVTSVDGMLIRRAKTFVLRCHACYHVTTNMDKQFCPSCGNGGTLVKIAASVDKNGQTQYHTMRTKKTTLRGTRYSLPAPKGGRHAHNLILRQDQKEYQDAVQRQKRWERALEKGTDLFSDDYMTKGSPFGVSGPHERATIGFGRRNPNEVKRTGNRKKKSANRH